MLGRAGLITLSADTFTMQRQDRALPMLALEVSFVSKHRSPGGLGGNEASWHKKQEHGKEKDKAIVFFLCICDCIRQCLCVSLQVSQAND